MPGSAFPTLTDFVALNKLRASELNTLIDALEALKTWSAAGDMLYAYDADQLEKLTLTPYGLLTAGASVPAWLAPPAGNAILRHSGTAFSWLTSTSGAMLYANGSNVPAWLAKPAGASYLKHNGTVPSWGDVAGTMVSSGMADQSYIVTSSTSFTNMTGASVTLTLPSTSTIEVNWIGYVTPPASGNMYMRITVNGTADTYELDVPYFSSYNFFNVSLTGIFSGIPSGSRIVRVQWKSSNANNASVNQGRLVAKAFSE